MTATEKTIATMFSLGNLAVFERPGATIKPRNIGSRAGCHVTFPNGWTVSIQWGAGNYGSNYDAPIGDEGVPDATEAEIAAFAPGSRDLVTWADGDTVQGWCSMDRAQRVLDLAAEGQLMVAQTSTELRADDSA